MRPKLIGLVMICLVVFLLLASNPAMSRREAGTFTGNVVNATVAEVNNAAALGLQELSVRTRLNMYVPYVPPRPGPTPGPAGADLKIIEVNEYKYKQSDGKPDIYTLDFLVKNIGNAKSGESNIAYATGEICDQGGVTSGPIQPHLIVPALDAGKSAHVTTTITETPGCTESFLGIHVNSEKLGCFGGIDYCIPTKETNYDNNDFSGVYYVPDNSLPYSSSAGGPTNQQIADAIFIKINAIRAKYQMSALTRNSQLDSVAQGFSDSMVQCLTCPSGKHEACGNTWSGASGRMKTILNIGFYMPAENIMCPVSIATTAFGCDNVPTTVENTADSIAEYTLSSWVEHDSCANDGHKKTVLSDPESYNNGGNSPYTPPTDVGIGVTKGSDGLYYITADFAQKK